MESLYDYGSRAGFWRLHRLFTQKKVPCTVFAVGMALERNPQACSAMVEAGWEVASHGYRWIDYQNVDEATEREHIARTVEIHEHLLGKRPVGFYQGKVGSNDHEVWSAFFRDRTQVLTNSHLLQPNVNTRKLVVEEGGFLYDSDSYADDLPYWSMDNGKKPHLIIPYTLSENDMRFVSPNGFSTGQQFSQYLKDTLKFLVEEGRAGHCRMMSVGLHCRIVGRPGRAAALADFMDFAKSYGKEVWICTRYETTHQLIRILVHYFVCLTADPLFFGFDREDIAKHWYDNHYPRGGGTVSTQKSVSSPTKGEATDTEGIDVI